MRKYWMTFRLGVTGALHYRGNLVAGFATYAMFILVFFCLWRNMYAQSDMPEMTLTQMIWYLCITEIIAFGANPRATGGVVQDVKNGNIAYQLLRPYNYVGYKYAESMGPVAVNTLLFAAAGSVLGFCIVGPIAGFRPWTLLPGALSMILGTSLLFFIQMAIGLTAFFIEDPSGIGLVVGKAISMLGTFLPIEFLPAGIRQLVQNLPFSYVTWAPARLMVGFEGGLFFRCLCLQVGYLAAFIGLCALLMRRGRRAIQANGG